VEEGAGSGHLVGMTYAPKRKPVFAPKPRKFPPRPGPSPFQRPPKTKPRARKRRGWSSGRAKRPCLCVPCFDRSEKPW